MTETQSETKSESPKKHLSQETKNSIRIMVEGGGTFAAVAKEFGVSVATVQRYAKSSKSKPRASKVEGNGVDHTNGLRQQAEAFVDSLRNQAHAYEQKSIETNEAADIVEKELKKIA